MNWHSTRSRSDQESSTGAIQIGYTFSNLCLNQMFLEKQIRNETKIRFKVSPAQSSQKIIKNSVKDLVKRRVIKIVKNSSKTCQLNCQELIKKIIKWGPRKKNHSCHANLYCKKFCLSQKWAASIKNQSYVIKFPP